MNSRTKLRQEYHQETGKYWKKLNINADPELDYTKWLEDKIEQCNIANVVGQSEQLICPNCGSNDTQISNKTTGECLDCHDDWAV